MEQIIHLPLSNMFKNISNDDSYNYINLNKNSIQIKINLANEVLICDKLFYRNYNFSDKIVYETDDKQSQIEVQQPKLYYKIFNVNSKYRRNCIKRYKKKKILNKRIFKINNEILRINDIEEKIKNEIIFNLNLNKSRNESHYRNSKNKILGFNKYKKSLFLYDLHILDDKIKNKILFYINSLLNIKLTIHCNVEELYIYFSICKILKNIKLYKNYLNSSILNIQGDLFSLNKKYFIFNDILKNRIISKNDKLEQKYSEFYIFNDTNIYALDNVTKNMSTGYVLAFDKKWNVFPKHNDNITNCLKLS